MCLGSRGSRSGCNGEVCSRGGFSVRRERLDQLKVRFKQKHVDRFMVGVIYVGLGEKGQAFEWLEKAYQDRFEELLTLKVDPRLDSLRSDRDSRTYCGS